VGDEDIVNPLRQSRILAEKIRGAKLTIIPEAGHGVFLEKANDFNRGVLGFLKEH
jgi:pimeloyl-ACP methyl ester carboxylesterase